MLQAGLRHDAAGGAVLGDLPPHEATPIGGVNSVRGYQEGEVGTGRSFVVASGELRMPVPVREGGVQVRQSLGGVSTCYQSSALCDCLQALCRLQDSQCESRHLLHLVMSMLG